MVPANTNIEEKQVCSLPMPDPFFCLQCAFILPRATRKSTMYLLLLILLGCHG